MEEAELKKLTDYRAGLEAAIVYHKKKEEELGRSQDTQIYLGSIVEKNIRCALEEQRNRFDVLFPSLK